ncbi:MFS transporter [Alphaproteobacteria bacterium]|nr:MFS transporter [Alphaproteobacteria bacterium]GHT91161.1 MFS transporter [Alphaproteobacteria bacterium]
MEKAEKKNYLPLIMWLVLLVFFIYQFVARSSFPTVLTEEYMKFFNLDAEGVGALVSCYYIVYTLAQIPVGIIIDKCDVRILATVAVLLCASGVALFVATPNCSIASVGQMLVGLGSAFSFISLMKIVATWFAPKERAILISYTLSIGCLGPVVFGPIVALIVEKFDWRYVMMAFSVLGVLVAALLWSVVREKKQDKHASKKESIPILKSLKMLLISPQIWILSLLIMMQYAPLSALADLWGVSFIKKAYNVDPALASLASNMIYLGVVVGSPFFAHLAVRIDSYKKTMMISTISGAIFFSIIQFFHVPISVMFGLLFMVGFSSGATLQYALAPLAFSESMSATISSFVNMFSMLSGVILMPLIGKLVDWSWNGTMVDGAKIYSVSDYRCGFFALLATLIIGAVLSCFVKDRSPSETGASCS